MTDDIFVAPPPMEIDPERAFRDSVGTYESLRQDPVEVVLRVRDRARVLLDRRPLHSSQHVEAAAADGWAIARLRVIVCPELRSEILSMLPDVVVVQPATLREDVRSAALSNRAQKFDVVDGNRILILGEDEGGKTDDLGPILVRTGETFTRIAGLAHPHFQGTLLAPFAKSDDEDEEEVLTKNNSSVVMRITLTHPEKLSAAARLLIGGDAEVAICERLDAAYDANDLTCDLLATFHHCSWHTLSYDSISDLGEKAKISKAAVRALSHARDGSHIIASSKRIVDDDCDPPSYRAKVEYEKLLKPGGGHVLVHW